MRALAAELRLSARETGMEIYRRKLDGIAADLEEEAVRTAEVMPAESIARLAS